MLIRADNRLKRTTGRLLWLLWALSDKYGYVSLSEANMALLLNTNIRQVQVSLHTICHEWKYFRQHKAIGVHRPMQYYRNKLAGETDLDFKGRMQSDKRVDAVIRVLWVACDRSAHNGQAEFSGDGLSVNDNTLRQARRTIKALGHFNIDSGTGGRGMTATYTRIPPTEVERTRMEELVVLVRTKASHPSKVMVANEPANEMSARVRERKLDKVAEKALRELEEQKRMSEAEQQRQAQHRFEMENEFRTGPGIVIRHDRPKKKVIKFTGPLIDKDRIRTARIKRFGRDDVDEKGN
jgi:hypothetical protein